MKKKRKKNAVTSASGDTEAAHVPKPAPKVSTSLQGAIAGWKQKEIAIAKVAPKTKAKPAAPVTLPPPGPTRAPLVTIPPPPPERGPANARKLSKEEQNDLQRAFAGVQPLSGRKRGGPSETVMHAKVVAHDNEREARARLDALVGKTARIVVERDGEYATGRRDNMPKTTLRRLAGSTLRPDATLDLHGERAADVAMLVNKFVRLQYKKGLRLLLIIHGKGNHSADGVGVLGDKVIATLAEGGAAPLVAAFSTAHADHGGTGALMVELIHG